MRECLICKTEFKFSKGRREKYCSRICWFKSRKGIIPKNLSTLYTTERNERRRQKLLREKHHHWKGDDVGYEAIHRWLLLEFGKADRCENPNCVYPRPGFNGKIMLRPRMFQYAKIKDKKYERKRENFMMLCP